MHLPTNGGQFMTLKSALILTLAAACFSSAAHAQRPAPRKAKPKIIREDMPPPIKPEAFYGDLFTDTCFGYTSRVASDTGGWIFQRHQLSFRYPNARITTSNWSSTDSTATDPEGDEGDGIIGFVDVIHMHYDDGQAEYKAPYVTFVSNDKKTGTKRFRIYRKKSGAVSHLIGAGDNRRWKVVGCTRPTVSIQMQGPRD